MGTMRPLKAMLIACALAGCAAEAEYVAVAEPPVDYGSYLHTYHDGAEVYFIGGRWYRVHDHRWVYYRDEPAELYRYRTRVRAPAAYAPRPGYHEHRHDRRWHRHDDHAREHRHWRHRDRHERARDHDGHGRRYTAPPAH